MSADRLSNETKKGRRPVRISLRQFLSALPAALLGTLSISVFCYMRAFGEIGKYYSGELTGLLRNSLSLWCLVELPLLLLFYIAAFRRIGKPRLSSGLAALLLAFSMVVALSMEHSDLREIFLPTSAAGNAAVLLGFALLLGTGIELLYLLFDRKTQYRIWADDLDSEADLHLFLGASSCILLLWLPVLFICYPGSVMNDTRAQIMSWLGLRQITAANPVLTTVIYGLLYQIGDAIGGQEKGIFLNIMFQALVCAAAMGLTATYVCRYTRSKRWFWLTAAFFGLLPVWQSALQVLLKDVLHTGCFLFFFCAYLECLRKREKSWRNVLLLFLTALLVAFTRKAAFYITVICILAAALYHWRVFLLPYLAMLGVFVGLFWFSNNLLYPWLNISAEWESENYSLQFQQVALYCRTYPEELTYKEKAVIDSTLDYDTIVREYTPMISDGVKATFHGTDEDHEAFWQLYRQMFRRHPLLFVKSLIMGSFEHFNPWYDGINFRVYIARQDDFLTVDYRSDLHTSLYQLWVSCLQIPVLRLLIGTGLYAWLLLIAFGYGMRKKNGLALLGLLPSLILLIGLFMTHVNGEIRYGYPLIAAAPLCFAWVLYAVAEKSPENPNRGRSDYAQEGASGPGLFRRRRQEESDEVFEPGQLPPELPAEEKSEFHYKPGPVLRFVTRYIPVPKNPKTYMDFLKVLAIYLVLWNHTSNGFQLYNNVLEMPQHFLYLCASIIDKIAVPLFFMTSGALLLGREESWGKILRYRVRRFALILLVVSVISYIYYFNPYGSFSVRDFAVRFYTGTICGPLWYLYAYLCLLLTLPFLRKLARCMREQDYYWLLGLYLFTQILVVTDYFWFKGTNSHNPNFILFTSVNYVIFSLFGFYIDRVMPKSRLKLEGLAVLAMLSAMAVGATYMLTKWKMASYSAWTSEVSQSFFNTFIAIPSIAAFYAAKLWFSRHPVSGRAGVIWSLLATGTFGTYLFERYWRDTTWNVYAEVYEKVGPFAGSLIHILAACALGILSTLLYKLLTGILKEVFQGRMRLRRPAKKSELTYTVPEDDETDLEEIEILLVNGRHNSNGQKGERP